MTFTGLYGAHAPIAIVPPHLMTGLLVLGHALDGYWLLEILPNGLAIDHTTRGFHAIGSGFPAAQATALTLDNYEPMLRPLHHLKMLAYRLTTGCIDVVGQSVGGSVHLWSSSTGGPFEKATDDELTELKEAVNLWRGVERESLAQALGEALDEGETIPELLEAEEPAAPAQPKSISPIANGDLGTHPS